MQCFGDESFFRVLEKDWSEVSCLLDSSTYPPAILVVSSSSLARRQGRLMG